jgi:hypothetical protein
MPGAALHLKELYMQTFADYVPSTDLADVPEAIRKALAEELAVTLCHPDPGAVWSWCALAGGRPGVLLLRSAVEGYLDGEADRLRTEVEESEAEVSRILAEAKKHSDSDSARCGKLIRQARRISAEAYQARKDIDAVHAVLRRLEPDGDLFDAAD